MENGEKSAFPRFNKDGVANGSPGLTKLEYLSATVYTAMLNRIYTEELSEKTLRTWKEKHGDVKIEKALALEALECANALLEALEEKRYMNEE